MDENYYVYFLIDPDSLIPFYVGLSNKNRKRQTSRFEDHLKEAKLLTGSGTIKQNKIRSLLNQNKEPLKEIKQSNLSLNQANKFEIAYIAKLGRIDLGTGLLTNMTSGGDGVVNLSESSKRTIGIKNSKNLKGRKLSATHLANRISGQTGLKRSDEHKKKIGDANRGSGNGMYGKQGWHKGIRMPDEVRAKIGKANKGRIKSPETIERIRKSAIDAWARRKAYNDTH